MTLRRTVARIIAWWTSRRVLRTAPELAEIAREIEARRRLHRPVRRLMRVQRELVHARLAAELRQAGPNTQENVMSLPLGGAGLGFAYLNLAATSTRIARKYHESAARTDSDRWRRSDIAEWQRLKRQAHSAIASSSICERPRLP